MSVLNIQEVEALLQNFIHTYKKENKILPSNTQAQEYMKNLMKERAFTTSIPNLVKNLVNLNVK